MKIVKTPATKHKLPSIKMSNSSPIPKPPIQPYRSFTGDKAIDQALAGFSAGAVATITLHPLDLIKTRFQGANVILINLLKLRIPFKFKKNNGTNSVICLCKCSRSNSTTLATSTRWHNPSLQRHYSTRRWS